MSGILTGTHTRENAAIATPPRGAFVSRAFTEEEFKVVDVLLDVAKKLGTTPARVALAWAQAQAGVTSTIIGARTVQQLDDNLGGLDVHLSEEHLKALDEVSRPKLNFPYDFVRNSAGFGHGGATVNGVTAPVNPLSPTSDAERY